MLCIQYLPLICCSSEDTIYSVDNGELNLLSFELVMYVLQKQSEARSNDVT